MKEPKSKFEKVVAGLALLAKYPECELSAGHEEIYAGPNDPGLVTQEDRALLESWGWHWDEDFESWRRYV